MDSFPLPEKRPQNRVHFEEPEGRGCTHCDFCGDHGGSGASLLLEREGKNQKEDWLLTEQ